LLPLLVASCSTAKVWENPNVAREQWSLDRAACQDQARMQAEREFTLDQQANRSLPQNQAAPWTTQMDRFSAQQRQTQLFNTCMSNRGYALVPASEASQPAEASGQPPAEAAGTSPK
jgi:hypothetical protein